MFLLVFLLAAVLLVSFGRGALLEVPVRFLLGWIFFLLNNLQQLRWSSGLVASGFTALIIAAWALHIFASWLLSQQGLKKKWRTRTTLAATAIVLVLFAAAISGIGVTHQIGWLNNVRWFGYSAVRPVVRHENAGRELQDFLIWCAEDEKIFPERFSDLYANSPESFHMNTVIDHAEGTPELWVYLAAGLPTNAPDWLPLLAAPRSIKGDGTRLVLLKNGERSWLSASQYQDLLDRRRDYLSQPKVP